MNKSAVQTIIRHLKGITAALELIYGNLPKEDEITTRCVKCKMPLELDPDKSGDVHSRVLCYGCRQLQGICRLQDTRKETIKF